MVCRKRNIAIQPSVEQEILIEANRLGISFSQMLVKAFTFYRDREFLKKQSEDDIFSYLFKPRYKRK